MIRTEDKYVADLSISQIFVSRRMSQVIGRNLEFADNLFVMFDIQGECHKDFIFKFEKLTFMNCV